MSLKSELQEIHEALVGNFAAKFKEGNWWGHDTDLGEQKEAFDQAAQATLQTFIEELESLYLDNKMFIHMKGDLARKIAELRGIDEETLLKDMQHKLVEQKVADVRKVIKEG